MRSRDEWRRWAARVAADRPIRRALTDGVGAVGAGEGSVLLLEPDGAHLRFAVCSNPATARRLRGYRQPATEGITSLAVGLQQSLAVNAVQGDPRFDPGADRVTGTRTESILAIPLGGPGGPLGAVTFVNAQRQGGFDAAAIRAAEDAARRLSDALLALLTADGGAHG